MSYLRNLLAPEPKLLFFQKFLECIWRKTPQPLRDFLEELLFKISPTVPVSASTIFAANSLRNTFIASGIATFILCFLCTLIWTAIDGTFYGTDAWRLYFIQDITNILNYGFICPAYVAFSISLIVLFIREWPKLKDIPALYSKKPVKIPSLTQGVLWFLVIGIAAFATASFMAECLNSRTYPKVSWYVTEVTANGHRVIGALGVYYAILNFSLLVIVLLAMLSYFSVFALCISVGRAVADLTPETDITFDKLQSTLRSFTEAYLIAKWLTAILMLNAYTWRIDKPIASFNLNLMGLLLSFFGIFFVSIPRYYIELEWFKFEARKALALSLPLPRVAEDLRTLSMRVQAQLLDALLIGGFITSFWM